MSPTEVTDGHVVLTVADDRVAYMGSLGWRRVEEEPEPTEGPVEPKPASRRSGK